LLRQDGIFLAMKGKDPTAELNTIDATATAIKLTVPELEAERHVVKMKLKIKN
jgi:hypothetical protein